MMELRKRIAEKLYSITAFFFPPLLMLQMSHKIHAAALQVAHQKPQPALEKFILPNLHYSTATEMLRYSLKYSCLLKSELLF